MIGYLKGVVIDRSERTLILQTRSGVGYQVYVPLSILPQIKVDGETELEFYIYTHFRQDTLQLYGFNDQETKLFFETLIGISGVGPKLALDVLAAPLSKVRDAIESEDTEFLRSIKGLGKKTSERIILELKGKLPKSLADRDDVAGDAIPEDVIDALENLGYKRKHIDSTLKKLPDETTKPEAMIKFFLQNI